MKFSPYELRQGLKRNPPSISMKVVIYRGSIMGPLTG